MADTKQCDGCATGKEYVEAAETEPMKQRAMRVLAGHIERQHPELWAEITQQEATA